MVFSGRRFEDASRILYVSMKDRRHRELDVAAATSQLGNLDRNDGCAPVPQDRYWSIPPTERRDAENVRRLLLGARFHQIATQGAGG